MNVEDQVLLPEKSSKKDIKIPEDISINNSFKSTNISAIEDINLDSLINRYDPSQEITLEDEKKSQEIQKGNEEIFNFEEEKKNSYNNLIKETQKIDIEINAKIAKGEDVSNLQTKKNSLKARIDELVLENEELDTARYEFLNSTEGVKELDIERQAQCDRANHSHPSYDPDYAKDLRSERDEAKDNMRKGAGVALAATGGSILFPPLILLAILATFYTAYQYKIASDNDNILKGKKERMKMPKIPSKIKQGAKNLTSKSLNENQKTQEKALNKKENQKEEISKITSNNNIEKPKEKGKSSHLSESAIKLSETRNSINEEKENSKILERKEERLLQGLETQSKKQTTNISLGLS